MQEAMQLKTLRACTPAPPCPVPPQQLAIQSIAMDQQRVHFALLASPLGKFKLRSHFWGWQLDQLSTERASARVWASPYRPHPATAAAHTTPLYEGVCQRFQQHNQRP